MCCTRSVQVCCRTTAARWHASRRERQRVIPVPNGNLDKAISTESVLPRTIAKQRNGSKRLPPRAILEHRVLSASCTAAAGVFQGIIFGHTGGPVSPRDYRETRTKNWKKGRLCCQSSSCVLPNGGYQIGGLGLSSAVMLA